MPGARDALGYMTTTNQNPIQHDMLKMLKDLQNQGIKPAIETQTQALESMVTKKLITTLNTITTNQDRIYEDLQQETLRLQNQINYLSREVRITIAARAPLT